MNVKSNIVIREWLSEDMPQVRTVMWTTWVATYGSFIPAADLRVYFEEHYSLVSLANMLITADVDGFVAIVAGTLAGCERTWFSRADDRFYVSSLYVLPSHQGMGLGKSLLREAEQLAQHYGAPAIWLGVMEQNVAALEWYRKLEFQFIEESPFTMGHTTVKHLIGRKLIDRGSQSITGKGRGT